MSTKHRMVRIISIVLLGLISNPTNAATTVNHTVPLQRAIWYLSHIDGLAQYYPNRWQYTRISYTLGFFEEPLLNAVNDDNLEGPVRGEAGCNAFSVHYYTTNDTQAALTIMLGLITLVGCLPEEHISSGYLSRLVRTASYRVDDTKDGLVLYLFDASGQEILRFADPYFWTQTTHLPLVSQPAR